MKIKNISVLGALIALTACGTDNPDPQKLKGNTYVTKSGNTEITLTFAPADMRVNGHALNIYNASYTANGDNIKFGDMLSTMMAGPEEEMVAEQEYFHFMSTVEKYNLNGNTLILHGENGQEIIFTQVDTTADTGTRTAPTKTDTGTTDNNVGASDAQ